MRLLRRAILFNVLLLAARAAVAVPGAVTVGNEYQIKAAYLYKFAGYIEWPPGAFHLPESPITIGVIGADDMWEELDRLKRAPPVNNRSIDIRLLKAGDSLNGVHILFIGRQEAPRLRRTLESLQAQPVLTVSEVQGGLGEGSMINFILIEERIRFEVSLLPAERSNLKISSRLLSVAQKIEGKKP